MENTNYYSNFYRPKTFSQVVGQNTVAETLKRIAKCEGIVCRSIVLRGGCGIGKTTLARLFAKAMNSDSLRSSGDITGEENTEGLLYEYTYSDINSDEKINNIKRLIESAPNGRRVIVFDECNSFSNSIASSLVSIIERGSSHTMFVFTTSEDVAPNIKSLSLSLELERIPDIIIKKYIMGVSRANAIAIEESVVDKIVSKSFGKMRDALNLLQSYSINGESVVETPYDYFKYMVISLCKRDKAYENYMNRLLKFNIVEIRKSICLFIKNLYICQEGNDDIMKTLFESGIQEKLFSFFYTQVSQNAMRDEYGIEILLRSFAKKFNI